MLRALKGVYERREGISKCLDSWVSETKFDYWWTETMAAINRPEKEAQRGGGQVWRHSGEKRTQQ